MDIFRAKNDIPWISLMHFLRVNVTFYYAVSMICDIIRTANPFPYTVKYMLVGVR